MLESVPGGFYIYVSIHYIPVSQYAQGGLSGSIVIDNTAYYPSAQEVTYTHGPITAGTYYINSGSLIYVYEGVSLASIKSYKINGGDLYEGSSFNVTIVDESVYVDVYVEQYNI